MDQVQVSGGSATFIPTLQLLRCLIRCRSSADRQLGHDTSWPVVHLLGNARSDRGFLLRFGLLSLLLVLEDLLFVLLEADKVEVQVLDPVLLEQVLSYQAAQVYSTRLRHRLVLVQRGRVPLYRAEVPPVITHVQRLLVLVRQCVLERVRDGTAAPRTLPRCRVVVGRGEGILVETAPVARNFAVLDHHVRVRVRGEALVTACLRCNL